jgi:hypothetical protein
LLLLAPDDDPLSVETCVFFINIHFFKCLYERQSYGLLPYGITSLDGRLIIASNCSVADVQAQTAVLRTNHTRELFC